VAQAIIISWTYDCNSVLHDVTTVHVGPVVQNVLNDAARIMLNKREFNCISPNTNNNNNNNNPICKAPECQKTSVALNAFAVCLAEHRFTRCMCSSTARWTAKCLYSGQ